MEDSKIIDLFFARDENALREVSRKYGAYCMTIARNILNNPEEADECVNDTYMKAWEAIPPKVPPALGAFLGRITKNLALNRIRHLSSQKRGGSHELSFEELDEFLSGDYSVEIEVERREFIAAINRFLDKLPARQRQLFVGRYWGCYTLAELGARYGMSQNGVSESLTRTRKKLKKYLQREGFEI